MNNEVLPSKKTVIWGYLWKIIIFWNNHSKVADSWRRNNRGPRNMEETHLNLTLLLELNCFLWLLKDRIMSQVSSWDSEEDRKPGRVWSLLMHVASFAFFYEWIRFCESPYLLQRTPGTVELIRKAFGYFFTSYKIVMVVMSWGLSEMEVSCCIKKTNKQLIKWLTEGDQEEEHMWTVLTALEYK